MQQLTEYQIKKSFVNDSHREIEKVKFPPHFAEVDWSEREYRGWTDPKIPQRAYVIVPVDGIARGLLLRSEAPTKSQAMCNWCEDIHELAGVNMYVAKKAWPSGRNGSTLGALIHGEFNCHEMVRTPPRAIEEQDDPEAFIGRRIAKLSDHAANFVKRVRATSSTITEVVRRPWGTRGRLAVRRSTSPGHRRRSARHGCPGSPRRGRRVLPRIHSRGDRRD